MPYIGHTTIEATSSQQDLAGLVAHTPWHRPRQLGFHLVGVYGCKEHLDAEAAFRRLPEPAETRSVCS